MDECSLDTLLLGPPTPPPLVPTLAACIQRAADAAEGPEQRKALAWAIRCSPAGAALRALHALGEACGQSDTTTDAAAVGLDLVGACSALLMVREAVDGRFSFRRDGRGAPLWYLRVDAYGLAVYGQARGWCAGTVAESLRTLAEYPPKLKEAELEEIEPALVAVADRCFAVATEHARRGIGRELWSVLEMNVVNAAGWVQEWKQQ